MSIRREWFKRQIDVLARALASALGFKKKGETQAAQTSIETALRDAFGMDPRLALGMPLDQFIEFACRGEAPAPELLTHMADLFREWAELLSAAGREGDAALARQRLEECLHFQPRTDY